MIGRLALIGRKVNRPDVLNVNYNGPCFRRERVERHVLEIEGRDCLGSRKFCSWSVSKVYKGVSKYSEQSNAGSSKKAVEGNINCFLAKRIFCHFCPKMANKGSRK